VKAAQLDAGDRVERVANLFVERYVRGNLGESRAREAERIVQKEIIPKLGSKRLSDIKRPDVHDLLDSIVVRASVMANRTLAVLRRMFNWAVERGIVAASPIDKIKAPAPETKRERVLNDGEIQLAWQAFISVGWPFGQFAKLLLLTGARRDEVCSRARST
jgi:integrase